jgi:hypothetical protein
VDVDDFQSYEISRKVSTGETGSWAVLTTTTSNEYTDLSWQYVTSSTFTVSYRLRALDINSNYSAYSSTASCYAYPLGKDIAGNTGAIPEEYTLSTYPNPFNPVTNIQYGLKEAGMVELKVYDMLGREVAILVNEAKPEGYYSVSFNASNLPSGTYISSLKINGQLYNTKMILLK